MLKAKEMGMDVDGRSPEMKSFLEELKALEFRGYEFESADASFDLLLRRFLRGEELAFDILKYHVGVEGINQDDGVTSEATVKLRIGPRPKKSFSKGLPLHCSGKISGLQGSYFGKQSRYGCNNQGTCRIN
jgi:2-isopropylmalate synthase